MSATTIAEVIAELDQIIATAKQEKNRIGYFAALYRKVTIGVKEGIRAGEFEDGARMERLDVIFANRFLDAYAANREGSRVSRSWLLSFNAARSSWPIVLQHLLLGMNAHINLDLGIAAAETSPGDDFPKLKKDFNRINAVLSSLVGGVKEELSQIWPPLRLLDRLAGTAEDRIIDFSMEVARDKAWEFAEKLAPLAEAARVTTIGEQDQWTAKFGRRIRKPGLLVRLVFLRIRWGEKGTVPEIIEILE